MFVVRTAYSQGELPLTSVPCPCPVDRKTKVCFHCAPRNLDFTVGDQSLPAYSQRLTASSKFGSTTTQPPKPISKRRPQSAAPPSLGGRIPRQRERPSSASKGAPRTCADGSDVSRNGARNPGTAAPRCNAPGQQYERARALKPITSKARKPAWK